MPTARDFAPAALLTISALLSVGCLDNQQPPAPASQPQQQEPQQPRGGQTMSDTGFASDETLTAKVAAAGVATKYIAYFAQGKLTRIDETRQADQRQGSYEFYGARLVKYSGAAVRSPATLALQFDTQGAVQSAQADHGKAADGDINAIRTRAQLLRSHALAQRSTRAHATH